MLPKISKNYTQYILRVIPDDCPNPAYTHHQLVQEQAHVI